jgi:hypothetical protein
MPDTRSGRFGTYGGTFVAPSPSSELRNRSLTTERLSSGPRGMNLPAFLPFFDDQTGETAEMRRAYRKMLGDPIIKAALIGKIFGVSSQDLHLHPHDKTRDRDKQISEFEHWMLTRRLSGGVPHLIWNLLIGACVDGYSVLEKVWRLQDRGKYRGKWVVTHLKAKDPDNDLVLDIDEFRNIVGVRGMRYNAGDSYAPGDFLIYAHLPLFENPTGMSDLRAAYSAYWMRDTVKKLRAMGLERRSLPILKGEYATASQKPLLETALAKARYSNWISVPLGVRIEALEIAGRSQDEFRNALQDLNEEIFLAIQYATLQALTGGQGVDRGDSEVHQDTASLAKWHLGQAACTVLNDHDHGLLRDVTDRNFRDADPPHATLKSVNTAALQQSLAIDQGLHQMGLDLAKDETYERYGRTPPKDDSDKIPGMPQPGAQPDMQPQDEGMDFDLGGGDQQPIDEAPPEEAPPEDTDQADSVQGQDLRSTVGGLQAIAALQEKYYGGEIPRDAAIANVRLLFGFQPEEAEQLFPEQRPEKLTQDDVGKGGKGGGKPAGPFDEEVEQFDEATLAKFDAHAGKVRFTGEKKDKRGRRICYQQGKRVACPKAPKSATQRKPKAKLEDITDAASQAWQTKDKQALDNVAAKIRESGPGSGVGVAGLRGVAKALGINRTLTKQELIDSILAKFGNNVLETQARNQVTNERPATLADIPEKDRKQAEAPVPPKQFVPQTAEEKLIQDAVEAIHGDWGNREQFEKWTNEEIARKARDKQKAAHSYKIKPGTVKYMEQQKRREDALQAEKASGVPFLSRFVDGFIDMQGGDDRKALDWAKSQLGKDPNAPTILSQLRARTIDRINKALWSGGKDPHLVDASKKALAAPGVQLFGNFGLRELQDMIGAGGLSKWSPEDRPEWKAQEKKTAEAKVVKASLQSGAIPVSPARAAQDAAKRQEEVERQREELRVKMRAQGKSSKEIEAAASRITPPLPSAGFAGVSATENKRRVQQWNQSLKEPAKDRLARIRRHDMLQDDNGRGQGQGKTFVGRVLSGILQNTGKSVSKDRESTLKDILAGKVSPELVSNALAHAHDLGHGAATPQEFLKLARAAYDSGSKTAFSDSPKGSLENALATRIQTVPDPERYVRLFALAAEETRGDVKHALSIADRLYRQGHEDFLDDVTSILTTPAKKLADDQPAREVPAPANPKQAGDQAPAPQPATGGDVALAGKDGQKAAQLLRRAKDEGAQVLGDVTGRALKRLLASGAGGVKQARSLFTGPELKELAAALAATTATAELLGRSRIRLRQKRAQQFAERDFDDDASPFDAFDESSGIRPLAPEAAVDYFRSLVPTLDVDPERFGWEQRREAFTLAHQTDLTLLDRIKGIIGEALESGQNVSAAPATIGRLLDAAGVSPRNPQYAEMVFRTNAMDAYQTGSEQERMRPDMIEDFPVWRYLGIEDGRQGKDHEPHFGKYYPAPVSFDEVRGARVFNCRCTSQPIFRTQWARLRKAGARIADGYEDVAA